MTPENPSPHYSPTNRPEKAVARKPFSVRISRRDHLSRLRVDGLENANWLLLQLSQVFVFRTFEPIIQSAGSQECVFTIPLNPPLSHYGLSRLIAAFPSVMLSQEK
jgi:hypothetical protein